MHSFTPKMSGVRVSHRPPKPRHSRCLPVLSGRALARFVQAKRPRRYRDHQPCLSQGSAALSRFSRLSLPPALPPHHAPAAKAPDGREFVGQHQYAKRKHPEAEQRQEAENTEETESNANRDAHGAGPRHVDIAPENADLVRLSRMKMRCLVHATLIPPNTVKRQPRPPYVGRGPASCQINVVACGDSITKPLCKRKNSVL